MKKKQTCKMSYFILEVVSFLVSNSCVMFWLKCLLFESYYLNSYSTRALNERTNGHMNTYKREKNKRFFCIFFLFLCIPDVFAFYKLPKRMKCCLFQFSLHKLFLISTSQNKYRNVSIYLYAYTNII